jgi:ribosome assembly protein RRB1
MITVADAHESDINVISWNKKEAAFLLSGGDDGAIKTWDLRQFGKSKAPQAIATFKHHVAPITSIEWHPTDSTVFGASGDDNQITLWDLAVERDEEDQSSKENDEDEAQVSQLPPQLLFIHQGQNEIKEIHWHHQIPGLVLSTALSGFDVFRTISV